MGLIISFVMVMVFRGFFFEPFHIPTGSMAPTLMGRHHRFMSEKTGFAWAVNSWEEYWARQRQGAGSLGSPPGAVTIAEPMTGADPVGPADRRAGWRLTETFPAVRGGDRIGIVKYNALYHPRRWDVIVVKWPATPHESYIKRLLALPGETLWLADGDVFVKKDPSASSRRARSASDGVPATQSPAPTSDEGWSIQRKPERVQRALWWPLFSSEYTPTDTIRDGREWKSPWVAHGADLLDRAYTMPSSGAALRWDGDRWPITDWVPYNDMADFWQRMLRYPLSDVRVRAAVEPQSTSGAIRFRVDARGCEFLATIEGAIATLEMRAPALNAAPDSSSDAQGREVISRKTATIAPLPAGRATEVELWHVDQSLSLWIDGEKVAEMTYDWSPMERLRRALKPGFDADLLTSPPTSGAGNPLADPRIYKEAGASIETSGAAFTLRRVGLDRDIHYQPSSYRFSRTVAHIPALATHPSNLPALSPDEFFLAGDNSANSADSRLVDSIDPWVAHRFDSNLGVVHRKLLTGRAVCVFFPAPHPLRLGGQRYSFIPDLGRVRWIR